MATKTNALTKTLSIGICAAAISMASAPAFSKQCMHKMGYMPHHISYGKYYGHGPKWGHGYKHGYGHMTHGYGHMYGHVKPSQSEGYSKNPEDNQATISSKELDLVETAVAAGKFNTLVKALDAAGLKDLLKGEGPYTVFAPTDDAFAKLPPGKLDELLANKEKLAAILKYHVIPSKVNAVDVLQARELKTAGGKTLPVETLEVAKADIETSNGTIHIVDSVLVPAM